MAERWYARLTRALDHHLSGRQPLVLYASHPHFEQTNVVSSLMGEGTGGVTESLRRRIVLPAGASLAETDHVVGHELVHAFQYDIAPATCSAWRCFRCGSSKAWPNTCRSARTIRTPRCGCATPYCRSVCRRSRS